MEREFIKALGSIKDYNYDIARKNVIMTAGKLDSDTSELLDALQGIRSSTADGADEDEVYHITKLDKMITEHARELHQATEDLNATVKGWFPSDVGDVTKINRTDPRDWFFNPVNCGDCHDCPLHSHLADSKKETLPCGAKVCIIRQLCGLIGR